MSTIAPKKFTSLAVNNPPSWLSDTFESPSQPQVLTTSGVYTVLGGAALVPSIAYTGLPTLIAIGAGFSLYFVNHKQRRFKRALLGTLLALIVGTIGANLLVNSLSIPAQLGIQGEVFAALLTFILLWIVSSFTK